MLKLEARPEPSRLMAILSPILAVVLTLLAGVALFSILGKDPIQGLNVFFVEPVKNAYGVSELAVKATPLVLIALGLAVCFRSNIWNIGAEGQFILGAIFGGGVAMRATETTSRLVVVVVLLAGMLGGMVWSGIVALLRDRFHTSEILVSLMLVYVGDMLLSYLVYGPWKDPHGYNFPQSVTFASTTQIPKLVAGYRTDVGVLLALGLVGVFWVFVFRTYAGFQLQVGGLAPAAARYAGFSSRRALWTALLVSGAMAGLAGALEVAGPLGQLTPYVSAGYGFAAIIVAFVGRLHPVGIVLSAILMSMFYIGGELAQSRMGLPKSVTGVFQGLLLFALLACDTLITYRVRYTRARAPRAHPLPRSVHASARPSRRRRGGERRGGEVRGEHVNELAFIIASTLNAGTALALAALGLLVNERSGIVNLGAEGMMLVAAIAGFATGVQTGSDGLAFLAGAATGASMALCFGAMVIWLNTNQYATGLALSLFGTGFSAFVGVKYTQEKLTERAPHEIPFLGELPFVGPALFRQHPMVYVAVALAVGLGWFLHRSRRGLVLRAIGESPESAHALGYPVRRIRLLAVVTGGALCGLAGAYISVVYTPLWVEGMVAGRGWIALALTTFATWRPGRVLFGAYLFGGVTMLQFHLQGEGVQIASQWLTMLPYVATIVVLVLMSRKPEFIRVNMPASLGKPFFPGS